MILTPREVEVHRLAALGLTNAEIGKRFGIQAQSVRHYVISTNTKLGLPYDFGGHRNRAAVWRELGWLTPPTEPTTRSVDVSRPLPVASRTFGGSGMSNHKED